MILADLNVTDSIERGFTVFFAWLPSLLAALAILIVGYFVARIVGRLVARVLGRAGFDRIVHGSPGGDFVRRVTATPSRLLGTIAFWALFLGAVSLAVTALGIEALTDFLGEVYAYLPNVIAALLIFLVAGAVAAAVTTLAQRFIGDTPLGTIVSTAAPILVMTIATFMILDQLRIAQDIVVITYAALLGAIALGTALAFGLGGRDVARELLMNAYDGGRRRKDEWEQDLNSGVERAKDDVDAQKQRLRTEQS
jgi:small-conductance mechanosensitive channel